MESSSRDRDQSESLLDEIYATTLAAQLTRRGECAICGRREVDVTEHEPSGFRAFCAECSSCNVCGAEDRPLGKHYGVASCGRCAKCFEEDNGKLIRLWGQSKGLIPAGERKTFHGRCESQRNEGGCSVYPEKGKKNCKHCLFRRCRAAGMRVSTTVDAAAEHSRADGSGLALTCGECQQPIMGFLHKCFDCHRDAKLDFNLCGECERRQAHPHHALMRFDVAVDEKVKELGESGSCRRRKQKARQGRDQTPTQQGDIMAEAQSNRGPDEDERRKVMRIAAELRECEAFLEPGRKLNPCLQDAVNYGRRECCNSVSKLGHVLTLLGNLREPSDCLRTCLEGEQQPQCSMAAALEVENSIQRVTEILASLQLCCGCCSCSAPQK